MNTNPLSREVLANSVIAVPPLARTSAWQIDAAQNQRIVRHLEAGGVSTLLYGGNANLYHVRPSEYAPLLTMLTDIAGTNTLVIPAVGSSFGMMMDQAAVLRDFHFPTAMILPQADLATPLGIERGVRLFVEAYGRPAVLYIKHDGWMDIPRVRRLVDDGLISFIKYAIVRKDPADDKYLRELVQEVDPSLIVSGIGEQPAIVHLRDFGLVSFTSGCVCVAPRLSQRLLKHLQAREFAQAEAIRRQFSGLEEWRNTIHPIRVLHAAVHQAGIADTGPLLPLLSEIDCRTDEVAEAARELLRQDSALPY